MKRIAFWGASAGRAMCLMVPANLLGHSAALEAYKLAHAAEWRPFPNA
jgi:hypothetical protein